MQDIDFNESKVKSLVKAVKVLECFSVEHAELGVTEIAQMTGYHKSTVHNILSTFCDMGYTKFNNDNSKYYLGLKLLHFSYIINTHLGLRNMFIPYMQQIADMVDETIYLGIPVDSEVLYIESSAPHKGAARNILGERAPMYCTGLGKVMLAFLPDAMSRVTEMHRFTDYTITDRDTLFSQLQEIRQRGWALDNMEHEFGVKCVAVPILDHADNIVAALSVSAPSLRMTEERINEILQIMHSVLKPIQNLL